VPPFSTALTVSADASLPVGLEAAGPGGGIDLLAAPSTSPSIRVTGPEAAAGPWSVFLPVAGPVPAAGSPSGTATVSAQVETATPDATTTGPDGAALAAQAVAAGGTGACTVELHVPETVGATVSGFLALTTPSQARWPTSTVLWPATTGDVLAVFPYQYTVGAPDPGPSPTDPTSIDATSTDPTSTDPTSSRPTTPDPSPSPDPTEAPVPTSSSVTSAPTSPAPPLADVRPPAGPSGAAPSGPLPTTGATLLPPALLGGALLLGGAVLLVLSRRRRRRG
jgi:LPXTG-motif cell wall-anchored protein